MKWVGMLALLTTIAAGPTTKPTTEPVDSLNAARAVVADAEARLRDARAACLDRLHKQTEFLNTKADANAKLKALEAARLGDDVSAKIHASGEYNRSRQSLAKLEAASLAADQNVTANEAKLKAAQADLASVQSDVDAANAAARRDEETKQAMEEARVKNDPIHKAIREHHLAKGMTLDQAATAMGSKGRKVGEDGPFEQWEWHVFEDRALNYGNGVVGGFGPDALRGAPTGNAPVMKVEVGMCYAQVYNGTIVSYRLDLTR